MNNIANTKGKTILNTFLLLGICILLATLVIVLADEESISNDIPDDKAIISEENLLLMGSPSPTPTPTATPTPSPKPLSSEIETDTKASTGYNIQKAGCIEQWDDNPSCIGSPQAWAIDTCEDNYLTEKYLISSAPDSSCQENLNDVGTIYSVPAKSCGDLCQNEQDTTPEDICYGKYFNWGTCKTESITCNGESKDGGYCECTHIYRKTKNNDGTEIAQQVQTAGCVSEWILEEREGCPGTPEDHADYCNGNILNEFFGYNGLDQCGGLECEPDPISLSSTEIDCDQFCLEHGYAVGYCQTQQTTCPSSVQKTAGYCLCAI